MEIDFSTELTAKEQALLQRLGVRLWHDWYSDRVCIHRHYWESVSPGVRDAIKVVIEHCRKGEQQNAG